MTLVGDTEPASLVGVALVRGPGSKPQVLLLQERQVGTKGKREHAHKRLAADGLEALWIADGAALLLRSDGPSTVHLKLQAKLVEAPNSQGALDAFAARLMSALGSGRVDAAAPTAESVLTAVQSVPAAKKPRASLGGGFRPSSNLGKLPGSGLGNSLGNGLGSGSLATSSSQRHVPRLPISGGSANRGSFQYGSARSSRMFDAAMGVEPPKRPSPYQLPPPAAPAAPAAAPAPAVATPAVAAPAPHRPPPSWPPPHEAARRQTPTHHGHQPPPLIRQQLLHPPASSGSGGSGGTRAVQPRQQSAASSGGGGFKNLGNTCYMNATLAALLAIRPFVRDLTSPALSERLTRHLPDTLSVYRALLGLVHDLEGGGTSAPRLLKQAIAQRSKQFAGHEQQDAHEFLSDCLDLLHDELVRPCPEPRPRPRPRPHPRPTTQARVPIRARARAEPEP